MIRLLLFWSVLAVVISGGCRNKPPVAQPVSICTVVRNPSQFNGKMLRVRARVETDGREHMALYDDSCISAGGFSVEPEIERGDDALRRALPPGEIPRPGHRVYGTFDGIFQWRSAGLPRNSFQIWHATDVQMLSVREK